MMKNKSCEDSAIHDCYFRQLCRSSNVNLTFWRRNVLENISKHGTMCVHCVSGTHHI